VSAQEHVVMGDRMICGGCAGLGIVTEVAEAAPGLLLVTYWTEHRRKCPGVETPDRAFIMSTDALDQGDTYLPGMEPPGNRNLRRKESRS
jgi:hypothetical protein